ncbi:hypothetical protein LCGC14_1771050 [marine sediment metagenome]|uniref:Bacterial sugar transferase domain-containing protein n=1 Tax=marine sediment metagenome TaxID=412755 RepID=A0A0F9JD73_9ZZZZ
MQLNRLIYTQERIGYKDKVFIIYKIRTMTNDKVTKIGKFLRETGLDELPQIINIIKRDMVLVGPRPLTPQDHKKFRRFTLSVKPGITGWWQIHGRNQNDIFQYDRQYIRTKSFWLDLYIILKTIPLVGLKRHG